jgi:hypothetical protein
MTFKVKAEKPGFSVFWSFSRAAKAGRGRKPESVRMRILGDIHRLWSVSRETPLTISYRLDSRIPADLTTNGRAKPLETLANTNT